MVADFMEQGHFGRHLRKMRALYATRRGYLVDALKQEMGEHLYIQPQAGGIHVLAHLRTAQNDRALAEAAQTSGLAVHALSDWQMCNSSQAAYLMGFPNFATAEEAWSPVHRRKAVLGKC